MRKSAREMPLNHAPIHAVRAPKASNARRGDFLANRPKLTGNELGWRLAGIVDGEGCFHIGCRRSTHYCIFVIGMRADDRPLLELLHASTGLGLVYGSSPSAKALESRPGTKPQFQWRIERLLDCVGLMKWLDRYPPISKKAGDYALWREAVEAWQRNDWGRMGELRRELMASRVYGGRAA